MIRCEDYLIKIAKDFQEFFIPQMSCQESLMEHYHDTPNLDFDFNFIVGNNFIFEYRGFDLTTCEKILT